MHAPERTPCTLQRRAASVCTFKHATTLGPSSLESESAVVCEPEAPRLPKIAGRRRGS